MDKQLTYDGEIKLRFKNINKFKVKHETTNDLIKTFFCYI